MLISLTCMENCSTNQWTTNQVTGNPRLWSCHTSSTDTINAVRMLQLLLHDGQSSSAGPAEPRPKSRLPRPPCPAAPRCPGAAPRPTHPCNRPPARPSAPPGRRLFSPTPPPRPPIRAPVLSARPAPLRSSPLCPAHPAQTGSVASRAETRAPSLPGARTLSSHCHSPSSPEGTWQEGVVWSQNSLGSARSACGGGVVPAGLHVTSALQVYRILFDIRSLYS